MIWTDVADNATSWGDVSDSSTSWSDVSDTAANWYVYLASERLLVLQSTAGNDLVYTVA